jgi:hypothetical protein
MRLKERIYSAYSPRAPHTFMTSCSNFFNPSKKILLVVLQTGKYEKAKTYQHPYVFVCIIISFHNMLLVIIPSTKHTQFFCVKIVQETDGDISFWDSGNESK